LPVKRRVQYEMMIKIIDAPRHVLFDALVVGHVNRHPLRSLITVLTIALGLAVAFAVALLGAVTVTSFGSGAEAVTNNVNLQVVASQGDGFNERYLLSILDEPGVIEAYPRTEDAVNIESHSGGEAHELRVVGVDTVHALPLQAEFRSRLPGPYQPFGMPHQLRNLIYRNSIVVSSEFAARNGARVGQTFAGVAGPHRLRLLIAGIMPSSYTGFDSDVALMDIGNAQNNFGKIGKLDRIDCVVEPAALTAVARRLNASLPPGVRALRPRERPKDIRSLLIGFQAELTVLSYVALAVAAALVYSAVAISVTERRAEIATVRALGVFQRDIFRTFVAEGSLYGLLGSLVGSVLGALLAQSLVGGFNDERIALAYDLAGVAKAFFLGVALATISAALPAFFAARIPPAIAMRNRGFESRNELRITSLTGAGLGLLSIALVAWFLPRHGDRAVYWIVAMLFVGTALLTPSMTVAFSSIVLAASRRLSVTFKLAAASFSWSPLRLSLAVASLTAAIALSIGLTTANDSLKTRLESWPSNVYGADLYIRPTDNADPSTNRFSAQVARRIASLPYVRSLEGERSRRFELNGRFVDLVASEHLVGPRPAAKSEPSDEDIRVSDALMQRLNLKVGEQLHIARQSTEENLTITSGFDNFAADGDSVVVSNRVFAKLFPHIGYDSFAVYAKPQSLATLRSAILNRLEPLDVVVMTTRDIRKQAVAVFTRTFEVENALGGIVIANPVLGLIAVLFAIVLERKSEVQTLRRLGVTAGGVRTAVVLEASMIGGLSCFLGAAMGIALAVVFIFGIEREFNASGVILRVPIPQIVSIVSFVMIGAVLGGLYPAGIAAKLSSAQGRSDG